MAEFIETVLRGGAVTTFLLLAVILLRDGRDRTAARLGALFCASTGWWALNTEPFVSWSLVWAAPIWVLSHGKYAAFWLFSRALFDDGFRMRPLEWAIWTGLVGWGAIWHMGSRFGFDTEWMGLPRQAAHLLLAAAAAWSAWQGRGGDLVEPRRRARIAYVVLSSVLIIGVTASYIAPGAPPPFAGDLNVARLFIMAVGMALLVSGVRADALFDGSQVAGQRPIGADNHDGACASLDEARHLSRLQTLMEEERIYRLEGLSIGALAARVGTPEYALRRLINRRLGHRNFNAYLNSYRLEEAKAALTDPGQRMVPISTIALDAGFGSLGPFNRAFKAAEGVTPTGYRERRRPR